MTATEVSEWTGVEGLEQRTPFGTVSDVWGDLVVSACGPADAAWPSAKRAELECFAVPNGWATPESLEHGEVAEYVPFAARSEIFTVTRADDPTWPAATARMIWSAPDLPLEEQFLVTNVHRIEDQWSWFLQVVGLERVAEWATLGSRVRNGEPMYALMSTIYQVARRRQVDYWVQSVTVPLLQGFQRGLRMAILQIGEPEMVVGALSVPTIVLLEESGSGAMLSWDLPRKRQMFGPWATPRSHLTP